MISVIQAQEVKLPDTVCVLAVNTCELATAAMPEIRLKPVTVSRSRREQNQAVAVTFRISPARAPGWLGVADVICPAMPESPEPFAGSRVFVA